MSELTRREFIGRSLAAGAAFAGMPGLAQGGAKAAKSRVKDDISLAEWSLVREFRQGKWKNIDLPRICREDFDINGIEFVNTFFALPTYSYLRDLKKRASDYGITLIRIMVDDEGYMASRDKRERKQAIINHRKWIDIAHYLGCTDIRANCRGSEDAGRESFLNWAADSFSELLDYADQAGVSVIIENHGGLSSDPDFLVALMKKVNRPSFGTLPDFGNFPKEIDRYEGIKRLVRYAKGVSVKSHFRPDGTHPDYDLKRLINICRDSGYRGFYGIETEGKGVDSWTQVRWTKKVIQETLGI